MSSRWMMAAGLLMAALVMMCPGLAAAPPAGAAGVVVLDTAGSWRMYNTLSRPVMQLDGVLKEIPFFDPKARGQVAELAMWQKDLLAQPSASPAGDWMKADFDDSGWVRGPAVRACRTPYLSRLCLRGKFSVTDPAKVQDLQLELTFHGGAVVYVNGQEFARKFLPVGGSLAEAYPAEAFLGDDGKLNELRGAAVLWKAQPSQATMARMASRERTLTVQIAGKDLRAGVNTIAVELVRAPYDKVVGEQLVASKNHGDHKTFDISWNTCEIRQVQLLAATAGGLVPNATRPQGFQIWNSDPLSEDVDLDFGDGTEQLRPIQLVGAINGTYSGKVVVGSSEPIRGLTATAGELKGDAGTIPAAQVRLGYGMPWGIIPLTHTNNNELVPYPAEPTPLVAIYDTAPKEIPVYKKEASSRCLKLPGQPATVFGAVTSVWVTVKVPGDAKPGTYSGQVTVSAEGLKPTAVPVSVKVMDWKLADPEKWQTWMELIECPDTTAIEYGLPRWSEKHWAMIDKSMSYLAEVGSKVVYVPLIAHSNAGNEESMVRWIKKGENKYDYDFSTMDKYLDIAEKHIGKPQFVVFNVWDLYMGAKGGFRPGYRNQGTAPPLVTVMDAAGKTGNVQMPDLTDPVSMGLWKPLFDQLHERLKKRGLEQAMLLGMVSDFWASREQVAFLKDVSGGLSWLGAGHSLPNSLYDGLAGFAYISTYFSTNFGYDRSLSGWKRPNLHAIFERVPLDNYPMTKWRLLPEQAITGDIRGVGRLGADTWQVLKDKSGTRVGRPWERYPGSNWGYLNCDCAVLAPSPEGPVATMRFEELREGTQDCEAIIVLEKALGDKAAVKKLGDDLAKSCQAALDVRRNCMWRAYAMYQSGADYSHEASSWRERTSATGYTWMLGSGWQQRSETLYKLAGEVSRKLE